jgi:hypothetical protein
VIAPERVRYAAAGLLFAGACFVVYPAIRPFSDEVTMQGAAAFASTEWLIAHVLAMLGFVLTALGTSGLRLALTATPAERVAFRAAILTAIGVGLTLPFYGAEAFGLHAIGQAALRENSTTILAISTEVRGGIGLALFLSGLAVLGLGAVLAAIAVRRSGVMFGWSGVPFAIGFALYIPQFFGTQPIRVAHGVLVAVGCLWIAYGMWRQSTGDRPS